MDRFWQKVDQSGGADACWLWTASLNRPGGYGQYYLGGKHLAHRFSYELAHGPVPPRAVVDHLCGTPQCVNPRHLEAVTQEENVRRGRHEPGRRQRELTHCAQGHPYDDANTYTHGGRRYCRACRAAMARRRYHERTAA